jgi:hypothetical protein
VSGVALAHHVFIDGIVSHITATAPNHARSTRREYRRRPDQGLPFFATGPRIATWRNVKRPLYTLATLVRRHRALTSVCLDSFHQPTSSGVTKVNT